MQSCARSLTTAEAFDRAMDQCLDRGLFDSAAWLSQLSLDATDAVLRETIPASASIVTALQDPPLTGRAHRHHVVAIALIQKGEYLRCHHHLSNALQEYTSTNININSEGDGSMTRSLSSSLRAGTRGSGQPPSPPSPAPPQLQFLCLYTLYKDGERVKTTSSNPRKSTNPHLRMLRGFLLSALEESQAQFSSSSQSGGLAGGGTGTARSTSTAMGSKKPPIKPHPTTTGTGTPTGTAAAAATTTTTTASASTSSPSTMNVTPAQHSSSTASALNGIPSAGTSSAKGMNNLNTVSGSPGMAAYGDPFLCWLYGVVLRELGMKQESATYFLAALCNHPMLWCAWEDLCMLVSRENQIEEIEAMIATFEPRFMGEIFLASVKAALNVAPVSFAPPGTGSLAPLRSGSPSSYTCASASPQATMPIEYAAAQAHRRGILSTGHIQNTATGGTPRGSRRYNTETAPGAGAGNASTSNAETAGSSGSIGGTHPRLANSWEMLLEKFPNNLFLLSNLAGYYYNVKKDLEKAQTLYKRLHTANPYRLEGMDDYSIVLFLRGDRIGLSSLAQQVYHVDPFRAESNFVVGNYYVLMGAHDRGVLHFRRAVAADPTFLAAWTLLGHAYLETKNSAAAVEAYRTAVDLDQRDYRGWYNLGQIYELLQFYHHALYYYWHTTTLRPTDPRMWSAVANCLDREGRVGEAMLCLERAEAYESSASDFYPPLMRRLCTYYLDTRQVDRAVTYLEKLLSSDAKKIEDVLFAVPHVAPYYLQQARQLLDAPARSPSYDAGHHHHQQQNQQQNQQQQSQQQQFQQYLPYGGGAGSAGEWLSGDAAARRSVEARWEQSAACLAAAEGHLAAFAAALGLQPDGKPLSGEPAGHAAAGDEGRSRHAVVLARYNHELRAIGRYLNAQRQQVDAAVRGER